ncbi:MAG TPA: PilZ domain-containing protein [Kofleriaceae bacterium]|nr:PilZ domain-containing protein [Kofleriaceae bacterium]
MSDPSTARPDRRRHIRIAPKGTVILSSGEHTQRGRIANISQGGLLVATAVTAPSKLLGRAVEMKLRLDGPGAEWLHASGRILRIVADGVAILFEELPASLVRMLDDMSAASRAHLRMLSAVLIDAQPRRRASIAEGLRAAGCRVDEAATPLEAIVRLGESNFEPDLIVVADSVPSEVADDLRSFMERHHPRAKLVTVGDELIEPTEPTGDTLWLSSSNPGSDLGARICRILGRPLRP